MCLIDDDEGVTEAVVDEDGDSPVDRTCYLVKPRGVTALLAWLGAAVALNLTLCAASWWRCYANHFLRWGALATWLLLLIQGRRNLRPRNWPLEISDERFSS